MVLGSHTAPSVASDPAVHLLTPGLRRSCDTAESRSERVNNMWRNQDSPLL